MREGWAYKELGEVCDLYQPKTISSDMLVSDGDYLVYGANGIIGRYNQYNHEASEVLVTCRGATCGTINISTPFSWINGNAMVVHPKSEDLCKRYLVYALRGIDMSDVITGAAQPQITRQSLSPKKLPVPPISEQQRIVLELDLLSGIIEKKKAQLKEYDQLAQSIFYDMFGDPVTNEKGWVVKKYKEFAEIVGGYAFNSDLFVDSGVPVLKIGNINAGVLKLEGICYYPYTPSLKRYEVHSGDLVISLTGTTGKDDYGNICIIPNYVDTFYLNQRNAILKPNAKCNNIFLQYVFKQRTIKEILTKNNHGVRQANILNKDIMNLSIPLPPLSLQQSFAEKIEAIEKQKELVKQSIAETETMFNYTMDKYFNYTA